jgi:ATP-dependent protease Clp ATPase subunit
VRAIARAAAAQPRLGARALKEVFRRVIRDYEFEPERHARDGALVVDEAEVAAALE